MVMLIDTHAHLNFNAYKEDSSGVLQRSLDGSTGSPQVWMINVGSQYSTSKRAVEMAEKYSEGVYAAIGLHPIHLETGLVQGKIDKEEIKFETIEEVFDYEKYKKLALSGSRRVVAIGEIGLDYKTEYASSKTKQKTVLRQQMDLAEELNLPIIFHCRMAHDDLIKMLSESSSRSFGVIHCFTGTWKQAEKYLGMGLYLGFNGIIFKLNLDEIIEKTPLDRILLETDCPYLTPPMADNKRNEPSYVKYVAEKIAKIKGLSFEELTEITTKNAKKLFKI